MGRHTIARAVIGLALLTDVAQGVNIYVSNQCAESMTLAHVTQGGVSTDNLVAGGTITKSIAVGSSSHVFKSGIGAQATLAEFSTMGSKTWYDISIIPTGVKSGPADCANLQACKDLTGGVGFNVAMQITPRTTDSDRCVSLTCPHDGCPEAYLFPKDDNKTHTCPLSTDFDLVFCPGGSGASTSVAQAALTPAPALTLTPAPAPAPALKPAPAPALTPAPAPTAKPAPAPTAKPAPTSTSASTLSQKQTPDLATDPDLEQQNTDQSFKPAKSADLEQQNIVQPAGLGLEAEANNYGNLRKVSEKKSGPSPTTQSMIQTTNDGMKQSEGPTVAATSEKGGMVQQANTRSDTNSGTRMPLVILAIGGFVGMAAVATIVVVRKKKAQLEEFESKTPLSTTAHGTLANFRTPRDNVSVL